MQTGQEADDLIGSLASRAAAEGRQVTIVTGDKDMLQLVGPKIQVYDSMKEKIYGEAEVLERFGVAPSQVVEIMGLMGDKIDNIPGVRGIAEKTARSLIQQFGTIEEALARLSEVKSAKIREILRSQVEQARLSRSLAVIRTDLPMELDLERSRLQEPDADALQALFRELEFTGLQRAFTPRASSGSLRLVALDRKEEADEAVRNLLASNEVAIAVVVGGGDRAGGRLRGLACSVEPGVAACLFAGPTAHTGLERVRPVLAGERPGKIGHDLKRTMTTLRNEGIVMRGLAFDTMVASYLLNPNRSDHSLQAVALEQLGVKPEAGSSAEGMTETSEEMMRRAAEEAHLACQMKEVMLPKLQASGLVPLFETVEMPLIEVLASMEMVGFKVDGDQLRELGKELQMQLGQLESRIFALAGERFNINSPKQLADVLFQRLQLKPPKRTKTGYSTDMEVLQQLARTL